MFKTKFANHQDQKAKPKRKSPNCALPIFFDNNGIEFLNVAKNVRNKEATDSFPSVLSESYQTNGGILFFETYQE